MIAERIEIGDFVTVVFSHEPESCIQGHVLYMPQATGDSWIIKEREGWISYVQLFERIILKPREEKL